MVCHVTDCRIGVKSVLFEVGTCCVAKLQVTFGLEMSQTVRID